MKGKNISHEDRNIRNNLVKFADNRPFSCFKAPQKEISILMKSESNSNGMKIHNPKYT